MNSEYVLTIRDYTVTIYEIVGGDTVCIYREDCCERSEMFRKALEALEEIVKENQ